MNGYAAGPDAEVQGMQALSDITMEGLVHVAHVRSPEARGRLLSIGGKPLPRGYRLITAQDLTYADCLPGPCVALPILARDRLSWRGEPVALVAGPDPSLVSELAASIEVDCDTEEEPGQDWPKQAERILFTRSLLRGDPDAAFASATTDRRGEYRSSSLEHYYSEPQGALAYFDYDRLVIRTATQWPFHVRASVAAVLGSKVQDIRVLPTRLGLHLDGKLWYPSLLACHAALAAKACKAPARILLTREEDFLFTPKGARSRIGIRAALDAAGKLSALDVDLAIDMGAYGPFAEEMLVEACTSILGYYDCPNLRLQARSVSTDSPPAGAFAGLGAAHAFYALESLVSRLAEAVSADPIDWRTRNLLCRPGTYASGEPLRAEAPLREIGLRLAAASDFGRKHASYELIRKRRTTGHDGPHRGIGFAFAFQTDGIQASESPPETYTLEATLGKDLRLSIDAGSGSPTGGVVEIWREEAARILGIDPGSVDIRAPDTDTLVLLGPDTRSRGITLMGRLTARACTAIQKRRFREALPISARSTARIERTVLWMDGRFEGSPFHSASWVGAVVEIELDPWTLAARPTGLWLCVEGGRIMSKDRALHSLRSASFDALGATACESIAIVDGGIDPEAYFAYSLRLPKELPRLDIDFLESGKSTLPKGIGDLPFLAVPAAYVAAVSQAAGYPLSTLPAVVDRSQPGYEQA